MKPKERVLVVDDSPTARLFVARVLDAAGFAVETAADIWIAPIVNRFRPDVILMDVHVGEQKGHIAIRALKKRRIGDGVVMALYSSTAVDHLEMLARDCGADGFFRKTDDPAELLNGLQNVIAAKAAVGAGAPC